MTPRSATWSMEVQRSISLESAGEPDETTTLMNANRIMIWRAARPARWRRLGDQVKSVAALIANVIGSHGAGVSGTGAVLPCHRRRRPRRGRHRFRL